MKIVDAQVHIWAANTPERPWPARAEPHRAPLGKEELLAEMDKAGVDRVIIVPPSWEGDRNDLAKARLAQATIRRLIAASPGQAARAGHSWRSTRISTGHSAIASVSAGSTKLRILAAGSSANGTQPVAGSRLSCTAKR